MIPFKQCFLAIQLEPTLWRRWKPTLRLLPASTTSGSSVSPDLTLVVAVHFWIGWRAQRSKVQLPITMNGRPRPLPSVPKFTLGGGAKFIGDGAAGGAAVGSDTGTKNSRAKAKGKSSRHPGRVGARVTSANDGTAGGGVTGSKGADAAKGKSSRRTGAPATGTAGGAAGGAAGRVLRAKGTGAGRPKIDGRAGGTGGGGSHGGGSIAPASSRSPHDLQMALDQFAFHNQVRTTGLTATYVSSFTHPPALPARAARSAATERRHCYSHRHPRPRPSLVTHHCHLPIVSHHSSNRVRPVRSSHPSRTIQCSFSSTCWSTMRQVWPGPCTLSRRSVRACGLSQHSGRRSCRQRPSRLGRSCTWPNSSA